MTQRTTHRLGRRSFLTKLGGGTTAVAIFGLAGCSGSDSASLGTSVPPGDSTSTESSEAGQSTTSTAPRAAPEPGTLAWERVNLGFVSAYVLARGSELAVVDTGIPGSEDEILDAITTLGNGWSDLKHLIITHAHGDHVGSVTAVMENAPDLVGHVGEADLPQVDAPRDLQPLVDGDEVFGFQIIGTPGHTPGHISVYDETSGLLLAGDAMNGEDGGITGANPEFTADMNLANDSVKRLSSRTVDTVVFGHGDPVIEDAQRQLQELASSL